MNQLPTEPLFEDIPMSRDTVTPTFQAKGGLLAAMKEGGERKHEPLSFLKPLIVPLDGEDEQKKPLFVDLSPYLDGTHKQELPTVAATFDGKHLFYAGRLNEIHAEPATGKTNVLIAAAIAVMEAGGSVLYIDPEDTPRGIVTRFLMLGALSDVLRERLFYLHNPTPEEIREAQVWAIDRHPEMSILDGLAESMAAVDADENVAGDVIRYYRKYLRPFADAGSAVVIADHVTKNKEGRGQFARGSGAKAGRYDGASYEIVMGKSYAPGIEGFVKLKVQKDRSGGIGPRECIAAELHFVPNASGGSIVTFREPAAKQEGPFRPTAIMDKIVKHLEVVGEATASDLRSLGGKTEYIATAIGFLKKDGKIDTRKNGNKVLHFLLPEKQTA